MAQPALSRSQLVALAAQDAKRYGVDPSIFQRQISQESGYDPNARSGAGALGIAQFMPGTAASYHIDPLNPVQALDAAARYDANELKAFGGDYREALAAYNAGAGNADKFNDPNFAGGQTYRYVRDILGGATPAPPASMAPSPGLAAAAAPAATPAVATPSAAGRQALLQAVMGQLSGHAPDFAALLAQARPAAVPPVPVVPMPARAGQTMNVQPLPAPNRLALAAVPVTLATRKGITLDQRVLPEAEQIAEQFGVRVNSGYRSPAHNAQVGGAEHSDHLTGDAVDFTGTPAQMAALQAWALKQKFPYVEPTSQTHGSHVHISLRR